MIHIILVDDEELFRTGIAFLLEREKNIKILFQASNGLELLAYLENTANMLPDIILMDLKMPSLNGVETTKILQKEYPEIKVIALSSYDTKAFIINMIEEGASSYIIKNSSPNEMITTINRVAERGFYYNNPTLEIIRDDEFINQNSKTKSVLDNEFLTKREMEILHLICKQCNNSEIAAILKISQRTVEVHRKNIVYKTETKNIAGLVVFAIQNNLVLLENITE